MTSLTNWARPKIEPALKPLAILLGRLKVKPDYITISAFFVGLAAIHYFLLDWKMFTILAIAHLFLDLLDGAVARTNASFSERGKWLDFWSDRTIAVLLLIKCTYLALIQWAIILGPLAIVIGLISHSWYFRSKHEDFPVFFSRSAMLILGMLKLSWLIIPLALTLNTASLIWQIWYKLNNL